MIALQSFGLREENMPSVKDSRTASWVPPERPDWTNRLNEEGSYMDIRGVVPLDEGSLLSTAERNTGLSDYGKDHWREPFRRLVNSYDTESRLNLMGRLRVRSDLLQFIEARLNVEETFKRHPEIEDETITMPMVVVGQGRSGTSAMVNLLSAHPDNGAVRTWEAMFPCPPPTSASYLTDPRIEKADKLIQQWNRIVPRIESLHEFTGAMPTECIHPMCISFAGYQWLNAIAPVPGYSAWIVGRSVVPALIDYKRLLKLLQWKNPRKHWILKAPSHLDWLPDLLEVFPDARFIWPHRDPLKALASVVNLIGSLQWCSTDHPFGEGALRAYTNADLVAGRLNAIIGWIEQGGFKPGQLCNLQYADFIRDRIAGVREIYRSFDLELSAEGLAAMQKYVDENPRHARKSHIYSIGADDQVRYERKAFVRYQQYFSVPDEE